MSDNQKKYNVKSDVKRISYIFSSVVMLLLIFCAFSVIFLLPIYFLSKYSKTVYSIIVLALIGGALIYLIVRKMMNLYKKYGKVTDVLLHLTIHFVSPILIIAFMLIFEGVVFRLFFSIFENFIIPSIIVIVANALIIGLLFLSRRLFFYGKTYLQNEAEAHANEK